MEQAGWNVRQYDSSRWKCYISLGTGCSTYEWAMSHFTHSYVSRCVHLSHFTSSDVSRYECESVWLKMLHPRTPPTLSTYEHIWKHTNESGVKWLIHMCHSLFPRRTGVSPWVSHIRMQCESYWQTHQYVWLHEWVTFVCNVSHTDRLINTCDSMSATAFFPGEQANTRNPPTRNTQRSLSKSKCFIWKETYNLRPRITISYLSVSTDNATPPKSINSRNSHSSVSRGTNWNTNFGKFWICTGIFEFLDMVDFGL